MTNKSAFEKLSRSEKLASILYPAHTTPEVRAAMDQILADEGRRPTQGAEVRGGVAQPLQRRK
jgi:hypothetical protein